MTGGWLVAILSLGAALAFAVSTSLKHASATQLSEVQGLQPRTLGRFVRATLAHRLWLGGIGADVVGLLLQVLALHFGALAVVQPLLLSSLIFALLIRRGGHHRADPRTLLWALLVTASLAGFLALAGTTAHSGAGPGADRSPAVFAATVGASLAVFCVLLGRRRSGGSQAALLGIAVGIAYAASATLLKSLTNVAVHGPIAVAESWQLYAVIAVGASGLMLNQLAFQAGPLTASLPAISTVDPLLSIAVGVLVYDEHIRSGPLAGLGLVGLLLLLGLGVIQLTRTTPVSLAPTDDDGTGTDRPS
ncbi:DMT family transporter [Jatrophihabitans sp. DSM 45814]